MAGLAEEHPVLAPGVGVADELERLADERMERMGDVKSLWTTAIAGS